MDEVEVILLNESPDIMILSETWLYTEELDSIQFPNYIAKHVCRSDRGGGVSILVKDSYTPNIITNLDIDGNNILGIEVVELPIAIYGIYRKPNSSVTSFLEVLSTTLTDKSSLFIGDLNICLLDNNSAVSDYLEILTSNGYTIQNEINKNKATRVDVRTKKKSIIDHVFMNFHCEVEMSLTDVSVSDHKAITVKLNLTQQTLKKKKQYYESKIINLKQLSHNLDTILRNTPKQNIDFETLIKIIQQQSDKVTTYRRRRTTANFSEGWFTADLKNKIKERDKEYVQWKKTYILANNDRFRKLQKEVRAMVKTNKQKHIQEKFANSDGNERKQWKVIKGLINHPEKENTIIKLVSDGREYTSRTEIAEILNDHFINIAANSNSDIQSQLSNTARPSFNVEMHIYPTSAKEIVSIITNLKNNTAPGHDGIKITTIKAIKDQIAPILAFIINAEIKKSKFPKALKIGKVTPIFKKGDRTSAGNYRPITVISVFAKVYEHVIKKRLLKYLDDINYQYQNQHGFTKKRSTQTALVDTIEFIYRAMDEDQLVLAVLLDLCKAFDMVVHRVLVKKLEILGIGGKVLDLFGDYLDERYQFTVANEVESTKKCVKSGVPQGSILGPVLFLLYIGDIVNCNIKGNILLYADDTILFYSGEPELIFSQAQRDLELINKWTLENGMKLNSDKCVYLRISKHIKNTKKLLLSIDDIELAEVNKVKYLGLILDSGMTFSSHVENLIAKLNYIRYNIRRNSKYLNTTTKYKMYNSLIASHLNYLPAFWGQTTAQIINKLQIAQNKVIKVLFNKPPSSDTRQLYNDLNLLKIKELVYLDSVKLIYKIKNNLVDTGINLRYASDVHTHHTRSRYNIYILPTARNIPRRKITYQAATWFNELTNNITGSDTIKVFTSKVKDQLFQRRQNNI